MKKILWFMAVLLGFAAVSNAQSRAIGLRFGAFDAEASYQWNLGTSNFMETEIGLSLLEGLGFRASGIFNWMLAEPDWTPRGSWGVYAGPGLSIGALPVDEALSFYAAVAGQVGLEYTFWFPLQLSVDIRPSIGLLGGGFKFYPASFAPVLSVRYRF